MLETISNNATGKPETAFLSTPRSMMPGSWVCDSPRVFIEPPRRPMPLDGKQDKNLSIEIPKLEEPNENRPEQRDAPEDAKHNAVRGETPSAMRNDTPAAADQTEAPTDSRFECDYDKNPTELFLHLQRKDWNKAEKRADEFHVEARTWVSRREKQGKLRWRLLPLHAAIIFKAPEKVVENLLAAYPKGAQSKDDQGMLPLHLAFRHGSTEGTVNLLLVAFPQSVEIKDRKGRIPLVLAQASASPNRDAFVRALERGPTYYANAAAATERAAVTAEQRAIFDAKLIEVEKKHQQDINTLKEERNGLNETVEVLQKELAKQKGATQVLVDHVNALEAQLKTKGETERFLAVKAATLDTNLKEVNEFNEHKFQALAKQVEELKKENAEFQNSSTTLRDAKAELQNAKAANAELQSSNTELQNAKVELQNANATFQKANAELQNANAELQNMNAELKKEVTELQQNCAELQRENDELKESQLAAHGSVHSEDFILVKEKAQRQEKELKSLKMDWASAQARAAVLEAQLKSKIENEHELASQVSQLAGKLAESAADNTAAANMYCNRVQMLEDERERLRATVNDLGKKLLKVSHFMNKMTQKTQENTKKSTEEARQKQAKLLADASNHEQLIRTALAERQHMAELLKKQEEEMEKSARQHQEILEQLAALKKQSADVDTEDDETIPFSNSLTEEMHEMMNNVLMGMPDQVHASESDLVDSVVESVSRSSGGDNEVRAHKVSIQEQSMASDSSSSDEDDDPQRCLEEALRALELSRTKSVGEHQQLTSMSEDSSEDDGTSVNYNPSDEESHRPSRAE